MTIELTDVIKDYTGQSVPEDDEEKSEPLTIRTVFGLALNNTAPGEILTPEQKLKIFGLAQRLFQGDTIDLTVDEATLIKERVGVVYAPLVYGRICEVFDGKVA